VSHAAKLVADSIDLCINFVVNIYQLDIPRFKIHGHCTFAASYFSKPLLPFFLIFYVHIDAAVSSSATLLLSLGTTSKISGALEWNV
jgi:hypothetical protein